MRIPTNDAAPASYVSSTNATADGPGAARSRAMKARLHPGATASSTPRRSLRRGHFALSAMFAVVLGGVAFACGSDDGNGAGACREASCDAGSESAAETGATDGAVGDGGAVDGRTDAEGSASNACGDSGGGQDPTFGDAGVVVLPLNGSNANAILVQSDGKTLLGGSLAPPVNKTFAIYRLKQDGSIDTAFGDGGIVQTTFTLGARGVTALAVDSTGRILAGGVAGATATNVAFAVVRYTSNGDLDTSFGSAGIALVDFGAQNSDLASMLVLADGHILLSGNTGDPGTDAGRDYALARLNSNGALDMNFGTSGTVRFDVRSSEDAPGVMAVQTDGKIIVAGGSTAEPARVRSDLSAVRFNSDGSLDTTFGNSGTVLTNFGGGGDLIASAVAFDPIGRPVLAGTASSIATGNDFAAVRLMPTGALDSSLTGSGLLTTDFGGNEGASGVFVQADGSIILAGASVATDGKSSSVAIARFAANGNLDPRFGTGGKVKTSIAGYAFAPSRTSTQSGCTLTVTGGFPVPGTTWIGALRFGL